MKRKRISISKIVLTGFILTELISCTSSPSIDFPPNCNITTIPFNYSLDGMIVSEVIIKNDTMQFLIDTGADKSIIPYNIKGNDTGDSILITDLPGIKKTINEVKLNQLTWGNLQISDFSYGQFQIPIDNIQGIIGSDILRNFCVKIDNTSKKIILYSKSKDIQKDGIKVPFHHQHNSILFNATVSNHNVDFKLDSGYNLELMIDQETHKSTLDKNKGALWIQPSNSIFKVNKLYSCDTVNFHVSDFVLGEKKFLNIGITHDVKSRRNLVGTIFMRRFKSVLIDYENKNLYFELPSNAFGLNFLKPQIEDVPISFLEFLYTRINSFGFHFSNNSPITVEAIEIGECEKCILPGDTLIGINEFLFDKSFTETINESNKNKFKFLNSFSQQRTLINQVMHQSKEATFHFKKNGKLISIHKKREVKLECSPTKGYSFSGKHENIGFYAIHFKNGKHLENSSFSLHIPWSTLSGQEIQVSSYKDDIDQKLSNKPKSKTTEFN